MKATRCGRPRQFAVDADFLDDAVVSPVWRVFELGGDQGAHLLAGEMAPQDVVLAGKGAFVRLVEAGAHDRWRRLVLFELDSGFIAGVAIEDLAIFVDVDRHDHTAFGDVGFERFELAGGKAGKS